MPCSPDVHCHTILSATHNSLSHLEHANTPRHARYSAHRQGEEVQLNMSQSNNPDATSDPAPVGGDTVLAVSDDCRDAGLDGFAGQPDIIVRKPVNPDPKDKAMADSITPLGRGAHLAKARVDRS